MSDEKTFSDEELTSYLDGELEESARLQLERMLTDDGELQERLDSLTLDKDELGNALGTLLSIAPEMPDVISETISQETEAGAPVLDAKQPRYWQLIAASLLALVIGYGAGAYVPDKPERSWREFVATYQALYANSTLAHIDQLDFNAGEELSRVSAAIGKELDLAAIQSVEQLDYKRAQILSFEGRPLIQLAFLSKVGAPVALCILQSYDGQESAPGFSEMRGMSSASWSKDGYEYLLIGGNDNSLIKQVAESYSAQL